MRNPFRAVAALRRARAYARTLEEISTQRGASAADEEFELHVAGALRVASPRPATELVFSDASDFNECEPCDGSGRVACGAPGVSAWYVDVCAVCLGEGSA